MVARQGASALPRLQQRGPVGLALHMKHMCGTLVDVGNPHTWQKNSQSPRSPIAASLQPFAKTRCEPKVLLPFQSFRGMRPRARALKDQASRRNNAARVAAPISPFCTTVKICRVLLVGPSPSNDDHEIVNKLSTLFVGAPSPLIVHGIDDSRSSRSTFEVQITCSDKCRQNSSKSPSGPFTTFLNRSG